MTRSRRKDFSKAFDRLAALIPNGDLLAAMDSVEFLETIVDELNRLNGAISRLTDWIPSGGLIAAAGPVSCVEAVIRELKKPCPDCGRKRREIDGKVD